MTRRILDGLRKAARVTCDSEATRDELLQFEIIPAERTVIIPNGVHPSCSPKADVEADSEAESLLGPFDINVPELLHVSSTIPRKRIDVLLTVFAEVRKVLPEVRLVRVGGPLTEQQARMVEQLDLANSIVILPAMSRSVLAAIYRRAALVLLPSEREGFGLPVVEAMACGTTVVASDLPVLHEVGGMAATYCRVGDVRDWTEAVVTLLNERGGNHERWNARRENAVAQASKFSWEAYAAKMVDVYHEVWKGSS
jgi:glycosyltransferase involved in cell wall biosynthesis